MRGKSEARIKMSWKCYELEYKAKSGIHIGYGSQLGILSRTRYYIPGKTIWGAVTAALSRRIMGNYDAEIYRKMGEFVKHHLIFSYFYPLKEGDVLYPNYTEEGFGFGNKGGGEFVMTKEEFEKEFISSYISTALDKNSMTAEEGSLHEFELISPVEFVGYLFTNLEKGQGSATYGLPIFVKEVSNDEIRVEIRGKEVEVFEAIREIQVGGERIYGFGELELTGIEEKEDMVSLYGSEMVANLKGTSTSIISVSGEPDSGYLSLAHVNIQNQGFTGIGVRGDIEPLVGREWDDERGKGAGQKISDVKICLTPGTRFSLERGAGLRVGDFGIWEFLR